MSSTSSIRLPGPNTHRAAAIEAVAAAAPNDRFAPRREADATRPERRNLPAVIRASRIEGEAIRPSGVSLPYLAQHIAQEVLGPSRMALDLRFHEHPGFETYAAMQRAEPEPLVQRRAWA